LNTHQPTNDEVLDILRKKLATNIQSINSELIKKSTFTQWEYEDEDEVGQTDIQELQECTGEYLSKQKGIQDYLEETLNTQESIAEMLIKLSSMKELHEKTLKEIEKAKAK
jgi:hypothetical protein